jgi:hypothetical protein
MIELMPGNFAENVQLEIAYDAIQNCAQTVEICKRSRIAPACLNQPFGS